MRGPPVGGGGGEREGKHPRGHRRHVGHPGRRRGGRDRGVPREPREETLRRGGGGDPPPPDAEGDASLGEGDRRGGRYGGRSRVRRGGADRQARHRRPDERRLRGELRRGGRPAGDAQLLRAHRGRGQHRQRLRRRRPLLGDQPAVGKPVGTKTRDRQRPGHPFSSFGSEKHTAIPSYLSAARIFPFSTGERAPPWKVQNNPFLRTARDEVPGPSAACRKSSFHPNSPSRNRIDSSGGTSPATPEAG